MGWADGTVERPVMAVVRKLVARARGLVAHPLTVVHVGEAREIRHG